MTVKIRGQAPAGPTPTDTFDALLQPLLGRAYQVALHLTRNPADAEDVVQEAALRAFRGFATFEAGSNFKAWFLRILHNVFLASCRKNRRAARDLSLDEMEQLSEGSVYRAWRAAGFEGGGSDPAQTLVASLDGGQVKTALEALPLEYRTVATLYFLEDLCYQDIASALEIPIGTVRSRLHRARRSLQWSLYALAEERGIVPQLERA